MHVLLSGLVIWAVLHFVWPFIVRVGIKVNSEVGGERVGQWVYLLAAISIALMFVVLVVVDDTWGMWDTEPAVTSIVATVAIMFGYGQLMAPSFFPAFAQSGLERSSRLTVRTGEETAVKLVVHNTGIVAWETNRISLEPIRKDGITELGITFSVDPSDPRMRTMNNDTLVQKNSSLLAVGEPSVLEFRVKAEKEGKFRLRVRVATDRGSGERHDGSLRLIVKQPGQTAG